MSIKGYSLFELIITFTLFIILSLIAIPTWQHFFLKNESQLLIQRLIKAIRLTQQIAIQYGHRASFCGSRDHKICDGKWDKGQIVTMFPMKQVIYVFPKIATGFHLIWQSSFSKNDALSFRPDGFTRGQQGHFSISQRDQKTSKIKLVVLHTGRVRISR